MHKKRDFTSYSETSDSVTEFLHFGNYGIHEATAMQYFLTKEGDQCYIVCQPKKDKMQVVMSYNTTDWVLDEELQHLQKLQNNFLAP